MESPGSVIIIFVSPKTGLGLISGRSTYSAPQLILYSKVETDNGLAGAGERRRFRRRFISRRPLVVPPSLLETMAGNELERRR